MQTIPRADSTKFIAHPRLWFSGLLALTVLVYLPGLHGPFVFDDMSNLLPIIDWLKGDISWQEVVFGNGSGLFGRSLSMLSFLASAAIGGDDSLAYKVGNLIIHLACGVAIFALLARLLPRDPQFGRLATPLALSVAALWLIHPIQVSTVLYVVQRMAQLSALFTLLALLAYVQGRLALEAGRMRNAMGWLFVALPAATIAAVFSKENGALVPLLCGVLELGYFQHGAQVRRPRLVKLFFCVLLLVPGVLVVSWYALHPQLLLGDYVGRTFTLGERLLSEPRALMDYMGAMLLPRGPSLGVYTDDFAVSHTLLDPPSTLFAMGGLLILIAAALGSRKRFPMFFTGIAFYLCAQVMESSVFALELYFEHRNYLPSMGFFLALVALIAWLITRVLTHSDNLRQTRMRLSIGAVALLLALGTATLGRSAAWSSFAVLAAQGASEHPQSLRAQLDYASSLQQQGKYDAVQQLLRRIAALDNPAAGHVAAIDSVAFQCMAHGVAQPDAVARLSTIAGSPVQLYEMEAFEYLANHLRDHDCENLAKESLAAIIVRMVDTAPQPAMLTQLWHSRFIAATLYEEAGQPLLAQTQAALAWKTGAADPGVGMFLAALYDNNGDRSMARHTLDQARQQIPHWNRRGNAAIVRLQRQLDASPQPPAVSEDPPRQLPQ